jgi:anti-sigma B factor antagonist
MEYKTEIINNVGYITLTTDLDCEQAGDALEQAFSQLLNKGKKTIVLDFSAIHIINSYGVGKIIDYNKKLTSSGGILMVRPLSGFVKDVFELLLLDQLIPVE